MGRIMIIGVMSAMILWMSGCAAVGAVSGIAADRVINLFEGAEESFPIDMRTSLVTVQRGLQSMHLDVSVLEPVEEGYLLQFSNAELDGEISLKKRTPALTTLYVQVHSGIGREESIERAVIEAIRKQTAHIDLAMRFQFDRYHDIYLQPVETAEKAGWYLPGSRLEVDDTKSAQWLRIKMPSGKKAFLKDNIIVQD